MTEIIVHAKQLINQNAVNSLLNNKIVKITGKLTELNVIFIAHALEGNLILISLNLSGTDLGLDEALVIANALKVNNVLTTLNLSNNMICSNGLEYIANALEVNKALITLNLSNNYIYYTSLSNFSELKKSYDALSSLSKALKVNKTLKSLDLSINNIGSEGAVLIANALEANDALTYLSLNDNNIMSEGAVAIAKALEENSALHSLDLSRNSVARDDVTLIGVGNGVVFLAKALEVNKALYSLDLSHNNIRNEGAVLIANALKANKALHSLDLQENSIGMNNREPFYDRMVATKAIYELLSENKIILSIGLSYNFIRDELKKNIYDLLNRNEEFLQKSIICAKEKKLSFTQTQTLISNLLEFDSDTTKIIKLTLAEKITLQGLNKDNFLNVIAYLNPVDLNSLATAAYVEGDSPIKSIPSELQFLSGVIAGKIVVPSVYYLHDSIKGNNPDKIFSSYYTDAFAPNILYQTALKLGVESFLEYSPAQNYIISNFLVDVAIGECEVSQEYALKLAGGFFNAAVNFILTYKLLEQGYGTFTTVFITTALLPISKIVFNDFKDMTSFILTPLDNEISESGLSLMVSSFTNITPFEDGDSLNLDLIMGAVES